MYSRGWDRFLAVMRREFVHLSSINASDRVWQMPFCAALATGLPLLIGAYFNHFDYGLVSSLGGLVFLYSPETRLSHRIVFLMACAFGMIASYTLGLLSQLQPLMLVPVLILMTTVVSIACRFYVVGPPGSIFFVMAAAIGAYSPIDIMQIPLYVGLLSMGCLQAYMIALVYAVYIARKRAPQAVTALPQTNFGFVVFDSVVIGVFVGISLALALVLQLERAYWVPVSCIAVMQGASLRAVWTKQAHRIIGTALGLLLTWGLLALPLGPWSISFAMTLLAFVIETLVVRHYGLAVIFITPLTILLAEASHIGLGTSEAILWARLLDTALGAVVGVAGGICLHSPSFREVLGRYVRQLIPNHLLR